MLLDGALEADPLGDQQYAESSGGTYPAGLSLPHRTETEQFGSESQTFAPREESKYSPAEPGGLGCEPLEAAMRGC